MNELVRGIEARDPRALGRAISRLERGGEGARELVERLYPRTGRARLVGLTGAPGAGKSTLVEALARHARRAGESVAVLAVDPTSPFTGGALLGDRVRMQSLYTDPGVFIRSMATRGALGGLAAAAHDAVDVLDAAGFDLVLVETVGVGQDEVDVVRSVDTAVVVVMPGMGDDIQASKAGLLEIADVLVLNKADREDADRTEKDLRFVLELGGAAAGGREAGGPGGARGRSAWVPPLVRTVATRDEGIEELARALEAHRSWLAGGDRLAERRRRRLELPDRADLAGPGARGGRPGRRDRPPGPRRPPGAHRPVPCRRAPVPRGRGGERHAARSRRGGERPMIGKIDHVGIAVTSIAEARRVWEALGLRVEAIEEVPEEGVRVALIPCGESRIELLEPTRADSPVATFLERRGPGVHHVCLGSDNVAADGGALRAAGVQVLRPEPTEGAGGARVQFVHPKSAGGVLVELSEPPPAAVDEEPEP